MPCELINDFCRIVLQRSGEDVIKLYNEFAGQHANDAYCHEIITKKALLFIKAAETARTAPPAIQDAILHYAP